MSNAELIAVLLGSGNREQTAVDLSKQILASKENKLNLIAGMEVKDLMKFKGIGEAKAVTIVCALELGRRRKAEHPISKPKITDSASAYECLRPFYEDQVVEEFRVLLLKRNNEVIRSEVISRGGVSGTLVDPKIIFKKALDYLASALIIAHNHPSGNLSPSSQDLKITEKIVAGGKLLDISILDHLIISNQGYLSLKEEGLM